MAFGVKVKSFKTNNSYSIPTLFEAIKDVEFTAGKPELTTHIKTKVIVFPAVDSRNQVWVMANFMKGEGNKFVVQKNEQAGLKKMGVNMLLDDLTGGLAGLGRAMGPNVKKCEQQVEEVHAVLANLGL